MRPAWAGVGGEESVDVGCVGAIAPIRYDIPTVRDICGEENTPRQFQYLEVDSYLFRLFLDFSLSIHLVAVLGPISGHRMWLVAFLVWDISEPCSKVGVDWHSADGNTVIGPWKVDEE